MHRTTDDPFSAVLCPIQRGQIKDTRPLQLSKIRYDPLYYNLEPSRLVETVSVVRRTTDNPFSAVPCPFQRGQIKDTRPLQLSKIRYDPLYYNLEP